MKPDHKIVLTRNWARVDDRVKGAAVLVSKLAKIAEAETEMA